MARPINFAKMAADLDSNPKIRRAGRNGREVFLFILRRVALLHAQGRVPVSNVEAWYLADQLQMSEREAEEGVAACLRPWHGGPGLLVITGGEVLIAGWDDEWGRVPMSERDRKRQQRARQREATGVDEADPEDGHEVSGQVVTRPDCHGSDQIRREEINPDCPHPPLSDLDISGSGGEGAIGTGPVVEASERTSFEILIPADWHPPPTPQNEQSRTDAEARGVVPALALRKFRERALRARWPLGELESRWREALASEYPTPARLRPGAGQRFGRVEPLSPEHYPMGVISLEDDDGACAQAARDRERPVRLEPLAAAELAAMLDLVHAAAANPDKAVAELSRQGLTPTKRTA